MEANVQDILAKATASHQAGHLAEAEVLYDQILRQEPTHADALHQLGVLAIQIGKRDAAIQLIRRAIAIDAKAANYHYSLGQAFAAEKRWDESIASYHRAIQLRPGSAD